MYFYDIFQGLVIENHKTASKIEFPLKSTKEKLHFDALSSLIENENVLFLLYAYLLTKTLN
jgi:hypothetical protein